MSTGAVEEGKSVFSLNCVMGVVFTVIQSIGINKHATIAES
jgi:hypothetical protein